MGGKKEWGVGSAKGTKLDREIWEVFSDNILTHTWMKWKRKLHNYSGEQHSGQRECQEKDLRGEKNHQEARVAEVKGGNGTTTEHPVFCAARGQITGILWSNQDCPLSVVGSHRWAPITLCTNCWAQHLACYIQPKLEKQSGCHRIMN